MAADLRAAANLKGYPAPVVDPATGNVKPPDPNQVRAWDTAMGVPAAPTEYDLGDLTKTPGVDPHFTTALAEELHSAHTPPALAKALAAGYERAVQKHIAFLMDRENQVSAAALKDLETQWGANFQERVALGKRAKDFLSKEVGGITDEQWRGLEGLFGTAKMMTFFWKIGAGNAEARFPGGDSSDPSAFTGGTSEAQAQYSQLLADRAAGKVSTDDFRKREAELANRIAGGFAPTTI